MKRKLMYAGIFILFITIIYTGFYKFSINKLKQAEKPITEVKQENQPIKEEEPTTQAKTNEPSININQLQAGLPSDIKAKIVAVKPDTIKVITDIHEILNNALDYGNKPSDSVYELSNGYAEQLNKATDNESWDYIIYDLKRTALNLDYASKTKDIQCLKIAHRILHDLDAHVYNINDTNYNKSSFGDSQTYRLTHNLPSEVPANLPPPGV